MRGTGRTICRRLAAHYGSIDALWDAIDGTTDLPDVKGIGSEKAALIHREFLANRDLLKRLDELGLNMGRGAVAPDAPAETTVPATLPLAGLTIVVTGSMKSTLLAAYGRTEMNELIEAHGGKSSGTVSAKTSLLVSSKPDSTKTIKARDWGVKIVGPDEFATMIGHGV